MDVAFIDRVLPAAHFLDGICCPRNLAPSEPLRKTSHKIGGANDINSAVTRFVRQLLKMGCRFAPRFLSFGYRLGIATNLPRR